VAQGEWKGMKLEYFVAGLLGVHGRALALATAGKSAQRKNARTQERRNAGTQERPRIT